MKTLDSNPGIRVSPRAFTLIELLTVIAVAGILAALAIPAIKEFGRSNQRLSATRQMLTDVNRARQLAIANRTTVYMAFLPNGFLRQPGYNSLTAAEKNQALHLATGQGRSYALISLRSIGDQPGQNRPQYLSDWKSLPPGWIIDTNKFDPRGNFTVYTNANTFGPASWDVDGFAFTNALPMPTATSPTKLFYLPYIAFNHLGQLTSGVDEYIPLARGTVDPALGATGDLVADQGLVTESPTDNGFTEYNLIHIDWLTGRARLETQEIE